MPCTTSQVVAGKNVMPSGMLGPVGSIPVETFAQNKSVVRLECPFLLHEKHSEVLPSRLSRCDAEARRSGAQGVQSGRLTWNSRVFIQEISRYANQCHFT